ncbi:MAG: DUF3617 domain-containing protein [Bdellovibrionales bacterium]|nr:DUF3617 domain-containing protein [Ramlibacter sp.]
MKLVHFLAAALLAACSLGASAQSMKPGLWEISNKMGGSPEMDQAMAQMQSQMASMSPEQRKMMQEMMARNGVSMGAGAGGGMTAKVCMTKEMVDRKEFPQQQGDCKQTVSPMTGNTMKFSFVCTQPPSSGDGQVTFVSSEAYTMRMNATSSPRGKPEKMTMDSTGKFVSADCGAIKPIAIPKK